MDMKEQIYDDCYLFVINMYIAVLFRHSFLHYKGNCV